MGSAINLNKLLHDNLFLESPQVMLVTTKIVSTTFPVVKKMNLNQI